MVLKKIIDINSTKKQVWEVLMKVESWKEWTSTIISIKKLNAQQLNLDSKVLIEQPKLPKSIWRITAFNREEKFAWTKGNFLLRIKAEHQLEECNNYTRISLSIEFSGLFKSLALQKYSTLIEHYLEIEATGLKQQCEALCFD